jgi:hypothetical protein
MSLFLNSRFDGRYVNQVRPIKIINNPINLSFSSVQITIGFTSVIVSIFKESIDGENYSESIDLNLYQIKSNLKSDFIKHEKNRIKKIINNLYPWKNLQVKTLIYLFILEDDGDFLMVALNAIFLSINKANFFPEID